MKCKTLTLLSYLFFVIAAKSANFFVSPAVVSNNYLGNITFQMTGLGPGETVQVEEFFDQNNNGVVDGNDRGIYFQTVQDGQVKKIAGLQNPYAFSDVDGATNGVIVGGFNFAAMPDTVRGIGNYLFRISSPSNHFATTILPFSVVSPPYAQTVQGSVVNNSTNVPFAVVALAQGTSGANPKIIVGKTADASGNFSIPAPPGTYQVLAFQRGYVQYLTNYPTITLAANGTVTTNVNLMQGNTVMNGALVDSTNTSKIILPYADLLAFSTNALIAIAVAESNGTFSITVTSNNVWSVRPAVQSALTDGYMAAEPGNELRFQTFTGPATNSLVKLRHATAVLYGKVEDNHSNAIPAITLTANGDGGQYDGNAVSDANGNYFMLMDNAGGFIEVTDITSLPANNFLWTGTPFFTADGQANHTDVIGYLATAHFRSHVTDSTGLPLTNLFMFANSFEATSLGSTDTNGNIDLPMFADTWTLYISALRGVVFPEVPPFVVTDGVNVTNNIIARNVTGTISGQVRDATNHGISGITITATNSSGTTNYLVSVQTDVSGNYSLQVFNGTWNVSADQYQLLIAGYNDVPSTNITLPPTNAVVNFIPTAIPPPTILTTNLPDSVLGNYYVTQLEETNGVPVVLWSLAGGTLPLGLTVETFGYISGTISNYGLFTFTVKATDAKGQFDTKQLTINVLQTPPLPLSNSTPTVLLQGAAGCVYSNHLQAVGGTPPYSWAFGPNSDPLPGGLTLSSDGKIYGTPVSNAYASLMIQVSDSAGGQDSGYTYLQINDTLQVYPGTLNGGTLGSNYFGGLYSSGGQQPQTWTITAGSLPPNLVLDSTTGYITGTPASVGTFNFTALVSDGCSATNLDTSITIYPPPVFTTTILPVAVPGTNYSFQLQVSGGEPPYSFYTSDQLPIGLTLGYTGLISGYDYYPSTNSFLVQAYDSLGNLATAELTLISSSQGPAPILDLPTILAPNQFSFRVTAAAGQSYTAQFSSDLTNWSELYTTNAADTTFIVTDTNAVGNRFYRIKSN